MKIKRIVDALIRLIPALICCALFAASSACAGEPLRVFVSIQPQAYFVEQIAGARASVQVLIPPGKSPAVYAPTPAQMAALAKAHVFFRIGVPFENSLMPKIASIAPGVRIVDTREGITLRAMEGAHGHDHHAGGGHHEGHGEAHGKDPHIWLNPLLVKIQARTIKDALCQLDPGGREVFNANFKALARGLEDLHNDIAQALAPVKGQTVFVFHPAFGYLCGAYGLEQRAVEIQGKAPKGKELSQFIAMARHDKVRVVFVQPQFDQSAAQKIAQAIDGAVVSLNPLARDYIPNLRDMAEQIAKALNR